MNSGIIFVLLLIIAAQSYVQLCFGVVSGQIVYFKDRDVIAYKIIKPVNELNNCEGSDWIEATPMANPDKRVYLGKRIIAQITDTNLLNENFLNSAGLRKIKDFGDNIFIFEAQDAESAIIKAQELVRLNGALASHPVIKTPLVRHWSYARKPDDTYFSLQWNLENRASDGAAPGIDINARSAWSVATGNGSALGISDGGIDLEHPELTNRASNMPHYNFITLQPDGMPSSVYETHGTHVAGIIAAERNNRGMVGVSYNSKFASWVIFDSGGYPASNQRLAEMYQFATNTVAIQVHSWGFGGIYLEPMTLIEQTAISNAVKFGRGQKGVIMIRSAGNERQNGGNANYSGYANDPRVITVGAVRPDGKVANYSNPGTAILVSAPSGDLSFGYSGIFTTDIHGNGGISPGTNEFADYIFGENGFSGTSASAPQIAGIVGLILSANSNLAYRDVQQILAISSRNFSDPFLQTNGAGLRVSFNTGFGVPDAGLAVRLALNWSNRPVQKTISISVTNTIPIPENGFRLNISGYNVPPELMTISALPGGAGVRADKPTAFLPIVHIPQPLQQITTNLTGKAALMPSVGSFFEELITRAASAGAGFAIIYNSNSNKPDERFVMNVSDYAPIPSVFISYRDGSALRVLIETNSDTYYGQIQLNSAAMLFNVTNTMLCEHVGLMLRTDHPHRGELRITLQSPAGTVSILQRTNYDYSPMPSNWVFYSTHHFFEQSAGIWKLQVSDEVTNTTGNILSATLIIHGVNISDTNRNGIDDAYEQRFNIPGADPKADPDKDGWQNAIEQILGTDPLKSEPLALDISQFSQTHQRLSWQGVKRYQIQFTTNLSGPWVDLTNVTGSFPESIFFVPSTNTAQKFFRVIENEQ